MPHVVIGTRAVNDKKMTYGLTVIATNRMLVATSSIKDWRASLPDQTVMPMLSITYVLVSAHSM